MEDGLGDRLNRMSTFPGDRHLIDPTDNRASNTPSCPCGSSPMLRGRCRRRSRKCFLYSPHRWSLPSPSSRSMSSSCSACFSCTSLNACPSIVLQFRPYTHSARASAPDACRRVVFRVHDHCPCPIRFPMVGPTFPVFPAPALTVAQFVPAAVAAAICVSVLDHIRRQEP